MESFYAENIKAFRKAIFMGQGDFGAMIGANRGAVAQYELGNNKPGKHVMERLCKILKVTEDTFLNTKLSFENINPNDFKGLTGKMIDDMPMLDLSTVPPKDNGKKGTPVYDVPATAGNTDNVSQLPEAPAYYVTLRGYEDCNFGMMVYGHSMYPVIETGSLVLCRRINNKHIIMYGEIYLVRTPDYLMVKRLQKGETAGTVLCTSDNFEQRAKEFKRFESFELPIDEIMDLYLVKGIIKKTQT